MKQKLYAIVSSETGRVMTHRGSGKLGIFTQAGTAKQHAWRYDAVEGNHKIVEYWPVAWDEKVVSQNGGTVNDSSRVN